MNESERTGFARHTWEGPVLESSHCLGSLPCVSCYMGSKCQHRDIPENPYRYLKDHISQLVQSPQLPVSFTFHLLPAPGLMVAICGVHLMVGKIPELWFAVHVFVSAVQVVVLCLSSPCALSKHLVCLALAGSP